MSNLNFSMILADEASAAWNARTYNAATSLKKRSKDGATMTPHSGKNEFKLSQSFGKKRRPVKDIEMNTEGWEKNSGIYWKSSRPQSRNSQGSIKGEAEHQELHPAQNDQ